MTKFGKALKEQEFPLLMEEVNLNHYQAPRRKIHQIFKKPAKELEVLIINFAHNKRCAVQSHCYYLSRYKMTEAVRFLLDNNFIEFAIIYLTQVLNLNSPTKVVK